MIRALYRVLREELGGLEAWWPAETPFERIAGAVLIQQTRWENVERVLAAIKRRGLMCPGAIDALPPAELEALARPAGFYRNKARSLKAIARYLVDRPDALAMPAHRLRDDLLGLYGVGDETADVIVLYAAGKPSFVVDAYARKTMKCLGVEGSYQELQAAFESSLPRDPELYRHYHALLVEHGKRYCNKKACEDCAVQRVRQQLGHA